MQARLFRFRFVPARTVVAIVVGRHSRCMVRTGHLSSDHPGNVDDDPVKVFTRGAVRFFDTASSVARACIVVCCFSWHFRPIAFINHVSLAFTE